MADGAAGLCQHALQRARPDQHRQCRSVEPRLDLVDIGRNGYIYVIDRATGEVYSADPYDTINATKGIDLKTGRPIKDETKKPTPGKTVTEICPNADGAKDWQPSAWSPRTHLIYVPHQHLCMHWQTSEVGYTAGTPYVGATVDMYAGLGGYRGEFMAWDPVQRKKVWEITREFSGLERGPGNRR